MISTFKFYISLFLAQGKTGQFYKNSLHLFFILSLSIQQVHLKRPLLWTGRRTRLVSEKHSTCQPKISACLWEYTFWLRLSPSFTFLKHNSCCSVYLMFHCFYWRKSDRIAMLCWCKNKGKLGSLESVEQCIFKMSIPFSPIFMVLLVTFWLKI